MLKPHYKPQGGGECPSPLPPKCSPDSIIYSPIMFIQAAVKSISKLKVMCPMCNEEEASVTMRPCGHVFCPG